MAAKKIKRIIIAGAGFSAPAKLPIQSRIIDKMTQDPTDDADLDFLSGAIPQESIKFLHSYIVVGLFLLDNYGRNDYSALAETYYNLRNQKNAIDVFASMQRNSSRKKESADVFNVLDNALGFNFNPEDINSQYYAILYSLKNDVRIAIKEEKIAVNLEDIFTSFDKSMLTKEYLHKYTYTQMDEVRFAITSLFIYYFSKCVQSHDYNHEDYKNFFRFIQKTRTSEPITIITTNWDTLIEEYCSRMGITYDYCFYHPYTSQNTPEVAKSKVSLIKIHGSINWLKCLRCGGISVYNGAEAAASLFKDGVAEHCNICGEKEDMASPTLQPEIITPTMMKAFTSQVYSNLWGTASRELQKSSHLVFVGYSLPIADFDFRYMLQKSVPSSTTIDVVLTPSSNPSLEKNRGVRDQLPERRYRDAFPKNEIHFYYDGFGTYFSSRK